MTDILISELRGVAIVLDVILILTQTLDVHVPRVPVALLGDTLRAPVRPDAELCVPKPIRTAIRFQGLPKWQKGTLRSFSLKKLRVSQCMSHASQSEYGES